MVRHLGSILAVALELLASSAVAQTTNNGTTVCAESGSQYAAQIASDGAGGAYVTWHDSRRGDLDIYVQRLGPDGSPLWAANGVAVCSSVGAQQFPVIVSVGSGGAIVAWYDIRNGNNYDIYAQRISASGVPSWTFNGVALCTAAGEQSSPSIAADGAGGAVIAWQDFRSGQYDVYAQRVNAIGSPLWSLDGVAICTAGSQQQGPVAVSDGSGGAVIVWQDVRSGAWDIYGQRVNGSGAVQWNPNGLPYCAALGQQDLPRAVSDGAGGAIATWQDTRSGSSAIFAQRLNSIGVALWPNDGVAVCTIPGAATVPSIVGSGAGGAIIAWQDARNAPTSPDLYAQQVAPGGLPQWSGNGIPVCTVVGSQLSPQLAADGADGATIVWSDVRYGNYDLYAQHVNSGGVLEWSAEGLAVCSNTAAQYEAAIASDGSGGAIFSWRDDRYGTAPDVFAQRMSGSGNLMYPDAEYPTLVSVRDVPNDQGGLVKLSWKASNQDLAPYSRIEAYWIWRAAPPNLVSGALASGTIIPTLERAAILAEPPQLASSLLATTTYFWEYLASQPAGHLTTYGYVAATTSDSVAWSNPYTYFMVMARTAGGTQWWYSNVDSGYSVDNLPPSAPLEFTATPTAVSIKLHWNVSPEPDIAEYRLYRGTSAGFVPGPSNLISSQPDTGFADPASGSFYYKLSAVDTHGNAGPLATTHATSVVDVPTARAPAAISLTPPLPNPMLGSTSFRIALPDRMKIGLSILDVSGRIVRTLAHGWLDAGEHSVAWDGVDDKGRSTAGGLYFVVLETKGRRLVQRIVRLE